MPTVCGLCPVGCNTWATTREGKVARILSRNHPEVDEGWLCDKGRFAYDHLRADDRIRPPRRRVRRRGFEPVSLGAGCSTRPSAASARPTARSSSPSRAARPSSRRPRSRGSSRKGSAEAAHSSRTTFHPALDRFRAPISAIRDAEVCLVFGDEPVVERAPVLDLWLRAARRAGAEVITLNPAGSAALQPGSAAWAAAQLAGRKPCRGAPRREAQSRRGRARRDRLVGGRSRRAARHALALAESLGDKASVYLIPRTPNGRGVAAAWGDPGTVPEGEIGALIVSGDEAAGDPGVRDLAERARFVLTTAMFESEGTLWSHLVLPGTSYLERDGTTVNLEGRPQRQRRAVAPPGEDELAFFAGLARRFGVEVDPWPTMLPDDHAALPEVEEPDAAVAAPKQPPRRRGQGLALVRYRSLFSGPAVERVPQLQFQRPADEVELSYEDASARGIAAGDDGDGLLERHEPRAPGPGEPPAARRGRPHPVRARRGPARPRRGEGGLMDQSLNQPWWIDVIKALVVINLVMVAFAYSTWLERKLLGRMQLRYGPNRAGPFGLLQPIADLVKLLRKESFFPASAIDLLYIAAPVVACFTALAAFSVIPFGGVWHVGDYDVTGWIANVSIGLLLIFALGAIGIYAFLVGGWASESKYSLLGSMRTAAQLVSYEVSLALSVLGVVIMGQSLSLVDIAEKQQATIWFAAPAVRRPPRLLRRRDRRDEPAAVRPPRGRAGARRRLPHRVQRHALRPLLDGRVHQHDHALRPRRDALLRRLGRAVAARADLVPAQARRLPLRLHLAARDAAAPALRPAHALRLEGPPARRDPERARHGHPGGAGMSPQPFDSLKGFAVTFRQIFKKPITQQYPEYKRPVYPRFRGRHRLWRHENGLEKCVGCSLCAAACPADCIRVVADENTADNRVSPGERYARIYEINLSRCIFCGYCELACPFDAITLEAEYELSEYSRDDLIYTKDMLLAPPVKRDARRRPRALRHADPRLESRSPSGASSSSGSSGCWRRSRCSASGIAVVLFQNPFYSALALIGNLASLAVLYLLLAAEFVAAAQVLVYAGAVVVMFLFVIAYLGGRADAPWAGRPSPQSLAAIVAAAAIAGGDRRRHRPQGGRRSSRLPPRSKTASARRQRSAGSSSATTCSPSR